MYALWLDVVSFQGGGPLLWAPLATMRNLFVSADNAGAGWVAAARVRLRVRGGFMSRAAERGTIRCCGCAWMPRR